MKKTPKDEPTPYAKALQADRVKAQERDGVERVEIINNGDCTASVNGVDIIDTANVPAMWIDRRTLCGEICKAFNEYAALLAVAEAAGSYLYGGSAGSVDERRIKIIDALKVLQTLRSVPAADVERKKDSGI